MLLLQFATLLSLTLLGSAGQHGPRLNGIHRNAGALAKRDAGDVRLHKRITSSKWTYYDAETGSAGACGQYIKNTDWVVAMNTAQYGSGYPGPNCFKSLTLSYGGKSAVVTVLDQCPGCPYGGLDLTPSLFAYFASQDKGIIYGEWEFGETAATTSSTWKATTTITKTPTTTWKATSTVTTWKPATTTTTKKTTTTTSKPGIATTTKASSTTHPTSSSTQPASSSSASPISVGSSAPAAGLAAASATASSAAVEGIEGLNAAFLRLGDLVAEGAQVA